MKIDLIDYGYLNQPPKPPVETVTVRVCIAEVEVCEGLGWWDNGTFFWSLNDTPEQANQLKAIERALATKQSVDVLLPGGKASYGLGEKLSAEAEAELDKFAKEHPLKKPTGSCDP